MENLIFNKWIELGCGKLGYLKQTDKTSDEKMTWILLSKDGVAISNNDVKIVQLIVQGRKVVSENGVCLDFGNAYPIATTEGKVTITKQFMKVFLGM